ncbi:hypothetical protein [Absidia glauca]|uniref:Barwin domain-containing protein n=1 Tax=Absidia glauca TaxID=4829 RepID=A0A168S836_ABSGL|nr:hypothetical protein [Absidia glauca]
MTALTGLLLLTSIILSPVSAILSGSARITPQDYIGLPPVALANNPPACGMPYATLDLSRITAVQGLNKATDCNKCIKVVNTQDPSKYVYVLAVDLGGSGLDLSIPSFKKLFGQQYDASPASWAEADASHCAGIYSGGSPATTKKPTTPATTTTKKHPRPTTTKKKPHPTTTKKQAHPTTTKKQAHPTTTKKKSHPTTTKKHSKPAHSPKPKPKKHPKKKKSTAGRRKGHKKTH